MAGQIPNPNSSSFEDSFVSLLDKLIGESKQLQNNPPELILDEDRVVKHVLDYLLPFSTSNGGPLVINHVSYHANCGISSSSTLEWTPTEPSPTSASTWTLSPLTPMIRLCSLVSPWELYLCVSVGQKSGDVVLKDLKLKEKALNSLRLPVTVKDGFIGTITLKVLHLLQRYLGEYVHGLSAEALRINIWKEPSMDII